MASHVLVARSFNDVEHSSKLLFSSGDQRDLCGKSEGEGRKEGREGGREGRCNPYDHSAVELEALHLV